MTAARCHLSFGPVPPDVFAEAQTLPYGKATQKLRQFAPTFGRANGETIKFVVNVRRRVIQYQNGTVTVEAETEDEAEKIAHDMDDFQIDWDDEGDTDEDRFEVVSVEAAEVLP